jgi:serine/threonine protein kinase
MGVILFVMVTGTLPFDEPSLPKLFERIQRADFSSPSYLSSRVVDLISKILVPDPTNRISIKDIKKHPWYEHIFDKDADEMASNAVVHADETPVTTLNISSSGDIHDVLNTIMTALRELSFAAITSDEHKIKGYKKSRRGMIGLTVNVSKGKNNEFLVAIRKGRGDALEYSEYLKRLVTKLEQGRGVNVYRPPPRSQDK